MILLGKRRFPRFVQESVPAQAMAFAALIAAGAISCVKDVNVSRPELSGFRVELVLGVSAEVAACASVLGVQAGELGSVDCPRPFPSESAPTAVHLKATALNRDGQPIPWEGAAFVDTRPGEFADVGPAGVQLYFGGEESAEVDLALIHAFGATRMWVEDCGSSTAAGSYASGVSLPIHFELPRIDQVNATSDNTTSPLRPRPSNICAISGDPRYGLAADDEGTLELVGHSYGGVVNAPPPGIGTFLSFTGCSRDQYDERLAAGENCERGPLVVTGIGNQGFYLTDVNPNSVALGFNSIFAFNFNYPEGLQVGDLLTTLRGAPVEFAGTTQVRNPVWTRDGEGRGLDLLPSPIPLQPDLYRDNLRTFGRNRNEAMDLERLESAVICVDNVAPASLQVSCDVNQSGSIERNGCLLSSFDSPLPPLCAAGLSAMVPAPPACDASSARPFCLDLSVVADHLLAPDVAAPAVADDGAGGTDIEPDAVADTTREEQALEVCGLRGYAPSNPSEYCCERVCYETFQCLDKSAYITFGQWVGDVFGRYDVVSTDENGLSDDGAAGGGSEAAGPVKMAFITRDANPDFDPVAFGQQQLALPPADRQTLKIIGNLRQVLAARPVWVVVAREPSDIEIGGSCAD